ncbi:anaphase-promoting complex, subunit 10-domain-containing protein [Hypoxylon sp. FL1150]|nr:anaphase-promoting complex, subunit 10-domain-containing protein [Hypoxylon sp. FL1150]
MEPQDIGSSGGARRNHASLRQQQHEFQRRLMRPDRVSRGSEIHPGDPVRIRAADTTELLTPANGGTRPDLQWAGAFQTPQGPIGADALDDADANADAGDDTEEVESVEDYDAGQEDTAQGDELGEADGEEQVEEEDVQDVEPPFDPSAVGLKEISNLASFTVSSYKPGSGVKELRDDDINQFWQSDGPQPHRLNIHFIKRVEIRVLRLYLDYELDESYTPTKIQIAAGFGPNMTIPFTTMELSAPKGWIDVPVAGAGGGADGDSLCCWFVRVVVLENHQNGKDTHVRGIKVYALDDAADTAERNPIEDMVEAMDDAHDRLAEMVIHDHDEEALARLTAEKERRKAGAKKYTPGDGGLTIPDFMREPELR